MPRTTKTKKDSAVTTDLPESQPSRAAELLAKAKARRATMEAGTVSSRLVESTGALTVADVRLTQPKAVKGYRVNVAASLDAKTPLGDLSQAELQNAVVNSAMQGDGMRTVIAADDETEVGASRQLRDSSDEDGVLDGVEIAEQLAIAEPSEQAIEKAIVRRNAAKRR